MTQSVDVRTPDGIADAYLARPDQQPHPGVLYVMDIYPQLNVVCFPKLTAPR